MAGIDAGGFHGFGGGFRRQPESPMGYGTPPRRVGAATQSHTSAGLPPAQPETYTPHIQPHQAAYVPQMSHAIEQAPAYQSAAAAPSYEEFSTDFHDETDGGSVANWIGGLCSLVLLIGLGFWGYQTIQRDVSGVPVIQALPGPMRVQPEDPEGLQASHQGLSVNTVQAEGRASEPPAQVVLAPQPLDLSAEGIAAATLPPPSSSQNGSAATTPAPQSELSSAEQTAAFASLADQLAAGSAPLGDLSAPTGTAPSAQPVPAPSQLQVISASIPGVAQSPRPPSRPSALRISAASPPASAPAVSTGPYVDPATIPAGTRLVQFGAFDSPEIARSEWERLSTRFADFMDNKRPVVQRAFSGGREFHRLRVLGFADVSEARRFCSVFLAENTPCIPVVAK